MEGTAALGNAKFQTVYHWHAILAQDGVTSVQGTSNFFPGYTAGIPRRTHIQGSVAGVGPSAPVDLPEL